jgi:hypothetical protein
MVYTWILIINVFAGAFAEGDSLSLTNIPGFTSYEECMAAGKDAGGLATGKKDINYVCVKQSKGA